jgi:limonene-1,2-epoxide hydrolase
MTLDELFNRLNKSNLHLLRDFYVDEVHFIDPVGELRGLQALTGYFAKLYSNVQEISFDIQARYRDGEIETVQWVMKLKAKGLNGGEYIFLDGCSVLKFKNNRCVYHRDYYDMGAFIYERIPILKWPIQFIKSRLSH